jgi:hypothetical protein
MNGFLGPRSEIKLNFNDSRGLAGASPNLELKLFGEGRKDGEFCEGRRDFAFGCGLLFCCRLHFEVDASKSHLELIDSKVVLRTDSGPVQIMAMSRKVEFEN